MKKVVLFSLSMLTAASAFLSGASSAAAAQSTPVTINIFAPQDPLRNMATNAFTLSLEKMFNVQFNWTTTTYDSTSAAEKRNLALASGDYPDTFVLIPWVDQFSQVDLLKYGQQGVILPLNDLIDQYAPHIKAQLDSNPTYKAMTVAPDGKIWGLPQLNECYHCSYGNKMWINNTWLKKVGLSQPKTLDDFKNMLVTFQTKDANGDGKPDEVLGGATMDYGTRPIPYLMNGFTYDDDRTYLILNGGKVDTVANTAAWKKGLTYVKSLYDAHVLDQSAFTNNADAYMAQGDNASAETLSAGAGMHPWIFVNCADNAKPAYCADYDPLPPLQGPNASYATYIPNTVPGGSFVLTSKASKDVQIAMIKIMDYMYTFDGSMAGQFGVKGVDWRDPQPGELANNQSVKPLYYVIPHPDTSDNNSWGAGAQFDSYGAFRDAQVESPNIYTADGYEHRLLLATNLYKGKESPNLYPFWAVWPDATLADEQSLLKQNINDYINTNALAFITGSKSLDTDWDAYVKGLDGLNLTRYLQIVQQEYDASKANIAAMSAAPAATSVATMAATAQ